MKKILSALFIFSLLFTVTACGNGGSRVDSVQTEKTKSGSNQTAADTSSNDEQAEAAEPLESAPEMTEPLENGTGTSGDENNSKDSHILVAYFSLAGEQYEVGVIEKGNTEIVAEMIAEGTGADMFKIEATTEYPATYNELLEVSQQEADAPPEIAGTVENMADYDTVFIGYPIWWGDTPAIIKVFLQSYDFSGKTIIPFCTHGGSGLAGTDRTISELCPDSTIGEGLTVRGSTAQNDRDSARESVTEWLTDNGYAKE